MYCFHRLFSHIVLMSYTPTQKKRANNISGGLLPVTMVNRVSAKPPVLLSAYTLKNLIHRLRRSPFPSGEGLVTVFRVLRQNMNATLTPPVKPCFFPAKPLRFRSRLHREFSSGFMVAPISARTLAPLVSAPRIATPSALPVALPPSSCSYASPP